MEHIEIKGKVAGVSFGYYLGVEDRIKLNDSIYLIIKCPQDACDSYDYMDAVIQLSRD